MKNKVQQNKKRNLYGKSRLRLTKKGKRKQTIYVYQSKSSFGWPGQLSLADLK